MTDPPVELPIRTLTDESDAPKHQQLREILEDVCINYLNPGDMLPGERVLEEQYGVSRITVRRAIGDLVASGKLRRARGKGTFAGGASTSRQLFRRDGGAKHYLFIKDFALGVDNGPGRNSDFLQFADDQAAHASTTPPAGQWETILH